MDGSFIGGVILALCAYGFVQMVFPPADRKKDNPQYDDNIGDGDDDRFDLD